MASATATIQSDYFHPQHMLAAYNYSDASTYTCAACELVVTGAGYRCGECDFNIHKACFTGLPGSIYISLGGEHDYRWALTRLDTSRPCCLCEKTSHAGRYMYMYRAGTGAGAGAATSTSDDGGGVCMHPWCVLTSSPYFHPQHYLAPYGYGTRSTSTKCAACELVLTGHEYRCGECDFNIHKACSSLPLSISFGQHSQHELTLTRLGASRWCDICKETSLAGAYMYRCVPCDYDVHPRCRHTLQQPDGDHRPVQQTLQQPYVVHRHNNNERVIHAAHTAPHATHMVLNAMAASGACTIL